MSRVIKHRWRLCAATLTFGLGVGLSGLCPPRPLLPATPPKACEVVTLLPDGTGAQLTPSPEVAIEAAPGEPLRYAVDSRAQSG